MGDVIAKVEVPRQHFTWEEYPGMVETRVLGPDDRVELIEGEIVQRSPIGLRHSLCVAALVDQLVRTVGDRALLWSPNPIRLSPHTMPEPDVVFVQRPLSRYSQGHPVTADVMLLVEVADTSYRYDRYVKLPLYARAGLPEAWIIDLNHDAVEVFRTPSPTGYASMQRMERGETVAALAFPDVVFRVAEILPPSPGD
jgi:hypothetical protein